LRKESAGKFVPEPRECGVLRLNVLAQYACRLWPSGADGTLGGGR
jgi:hypothetical protein